MTESTGDRPDQPGEGEEPVLAHRGPATSGGRVTTEDDDDATRPPEQDGRREPRGGYEPV